MIFIIGFTACGKTTIGRNLAIYSKCPFIDLDEEIEQFAGLTVKEYIEKCGENEFRKLETETLKRVISGSAEKTVVATGGGTPCLNDNMTLLLSSGLVIYVEASTNEILQNLNKVELSNRPLIKGKGRGEIKQWIRTTLAEREPFYSFAHLKVPSIVAKSPELLTNAIFLFTKSNPVERT
jgi:shikimate kinase